MLQAAGLSVCIMVVRVGGWVGCSSGAARVVVVMIGTLALRFCCLHLLHHQAGCQGGGRSLEPYNTNLSTFKACPATTQPHPLTLPTLAEHTLRMCKHMHTQTQHLPSSPPPTNTW